MGMIHYRLVLESLAPEADPDRVRAVLRRIRPGMDTSGPDVEAWFPLELQRRFDQRAASDWLDALGRAGIRARIEVMATGQEPGTDEPLVQGQAPRPAPGPFGFWWLLLSDPEAAFGRSLDWGPGHGLLFGWLFAALGTVLGLPGQLWVQDWAGVGGGIGAATVVSSVLVWPLVKMAFLAAGLWLLLRWPGPSPAWVDLLALVGYTQAFAPLEIIPLLGPILSGAGALWLLGVGLHARFDLPVSRLLAVLLLPPTLVMALLAGLALLAFSLLGQAQSLDTGSLWRLFH